MTKDEYSSEMEMYGVSPRVIAIIMFLITMIAPQGYVPHNLSIPPVFYLEPMIYSFLWKISLQPLHSTLPFCGWSTMDLFALLPLTVLNWVFALWVVRYYQARSSRYNTIMLGVIANLLPLFLIYYYSAPFPEYHIIYPIPIQFILGLIILWRIEGPEVISPWSGMRLDLSWWKWRRSKPKDDWDPFAEEKKAGATDNDIESSD
ncbi:MAG: hypothetical protein ACFFE2_05250 [Candidatus Thorarchaeota archaeon]